MWKRFNVRTAFADDGLDDGLGLCTPAVATIRKKLTERTPAV
jgi:hypothetical protein